MVSGDKKVTKGAYGEHIFSWGCMPQRRTPRETFPSFRAGFPFDYESAYGKSTGRKGNHDVEMFLGIPMSTGMRKNKS